MREMSEIYLDYKKVNVYGAGLAGSEAAWQLAERGVKVDLYEMKPHKKSAAHKNNNFAELVCSNSLRADSLQNAVGLLKEEMRLLNSIIMEAADATRVPAGGALAVDREGFSSYITEKLRNHPNINIIEEEVSGVDENTPTIIATGPLTSDVMAEYIKNMLSDDGLYFFDAAAPIVTKESIDFDSAFYAARYNKGTADYINCPMTREEYDVFYNALVNAEEAELHAPDKNCGLKVFEGCMPVEVMAKRGYETLLFGPLKPVGLSDPKTGKKSYAVVQLRQDNKDSSMYNIVGFQTHLKFGEQKRVFSLIPALKNAEFVRFGVMHRNTYINSPGFLDKTYSLRSNPNIMFAGQMTGVEGYVESASSGLLAGLNMARRVLGQDAAEFPETTAIGALAHYISNENITDFQPMNINFGIIKGLDERIKNKSERYQKISERSIEIIKKIMSTL